MTPLLSTFARAVLAALTIACADTPRAPVTTGQWIWSSADAELFAETRRSIPALRPAVLIGTLEAHPGFVASRLMRSPRLAGVAAAAIVVRFEDSFSSAWADPPSRIARDSLDATLAAAVEARLLALVRAAEATGVRIDEVQLDYDCPNRRLERWARLVARLADGPLARHELWLTSIVSHLRHPRYGELFGPHVEGHILQLFDTGDRLTPAMLGSIERLLSRHGMTFRIGVGAFERRFDDGRMTDHRAWFGALEKFAGRPLYAGVWVFPGSRRWAPLLASSTETGR